MYPPQHKRKSSGWGGGISESILDVCKAFCQQTSIHGLNHIAAPKRHWFERLVWVAVTGVAVWGVADISLGQWQRYWESPTVVTLQKDFRTWDYAMLAVTACEKNKANEGKVQKAIKSRWNIAPNDTKYSHYSRFINMVANSNLYNLGGYYEEFTNDSDLNVDLYELAVEVMPEQSVKLSVEDQITTPPKWVPVMTEAGACRTINSVAVADVALIKLSANDTRDLPVTCKYSAKGCYFILESFLEMDYYIHSAYDIPDTQTAPYSSYTSLNSHTELSTTETRAGPGVRALSPRRRHCHFTDEPTEPHRQVHSTNICRQGCKSRIAMKLCGCKPFYYFYAEGPLCTAAGMRCLAGAGHRLATFDNIRCPCVQQCVDCVFREITSQVKIWDRGPLQLRGIVRFTVQPPRMRYARSIVFHFQDLVVSFGGAAGLFLGASFISFVEILSFCLERLLRATARTDHEPVVKSTAAPYEHRIQELNMILRRNTYEHEREYGCP